MNDFANGYFADSNGLLFLDKSMFEIELKRCGNKFIGELFE